MTQATMAGRSTQGKPINLQQLQQELGDAGVVVTALGMNREVVYLYTADGTPSDFPADQQASVDQVITAHVALRDVTDAEYATKFQDPNTTVARKQEIRDITAGLLPREQVPVDTSKAPPAHSPPPQSKAHVDIEAATDLDHLKAAILEAIP